MRKNKIISIIALATMLGTLIVAPVNTKADVYYNENEDTWKTTIGTDFTGIDNNEYGWWYLNNGSIDWNYNGLQPNEYGWWKITNGGVDFSYTGIAPNEYGWWKVDNGKVNFDYTGVASNEYGWWYVEDGKVNFDYTGVKPNEYGWWKIENGGVNFEFTGIAENEYGSWYVENGRVNFDYTGEYSFEGKKYSVNKGKATDVTGKTLVKEAWDETVVDVPEHEEQRLVKAAWTETVTIPAEYEEKYYPEECYEKIMLDTRSMHMVGYGGMDYGSGNSKNPEAYMLSEVMDEAVEANFAGVCPSDPLVAFFYSGKIDDSGYRTIGNTKDFKLVHHNAGIERTEISPERTETINHEAEYETITVPATYKTIHHDAIYE